MNDDNDDNIDDNVLDEYLGFGENISLSKTDYLILETLIFLKKDLKSSFLN
jgi:hypothetical protein